MQNIIKPNYPENIKEILEALDEQMKEDIKALFDYYVPGIEECGEVVFTSDSFETLNMEFTDIDNKEEKAKFVGLFFECGILEKFEPETA